MNFKWPWSPSEDYEGVRGRGRRSIASDSDLVGIYIKNLKEASERLDHNIKMLQSSLQDLYKVNYKLVRENQALTKKINKQDGKQK